MSVWLSMTIASALLLAGPALAAEPPPAAETTVEGVVVIASPFRQSPPREAIAGFVADVSAESANGRLARWDRKICPGLVGVREGYARKLLDRIATTAVAVGLEVGEPGCKPNMIIIGTDDSEALVRNIVEENPGAFAKYDGRVTRGRTALKAFIASPAPVRWWHVTGRTSADGQKYESGESIRVRDLGRLHSTTRDDFDHVVIVMDSKRMGRQSLTALADYIAMVGLAQIEPDAEPASVPTILNLFADRAAGATPAGGLTDWDIAYLKGLYSARRDVTRGAAQERDMVRTMSEDLAAPPVSPKKD